MKKKCGRRAAAIINAASGRIRSRCLLSAALLKTHRIIRPADRNCRRIRMSPYQSTEGAAPYKDAAKAPNGYWVWMLWPFGAPV